MHIYSIIAWIFAFIKSCKAVLIGAVTISRRSAKISLKNGYSSWDMMDEPSRPFCTNLTLVSRSRVLRHQEADLGQGFRAWYEWSWLGGQRHHLMKHLIGLDNFCFYPKRHGSSWRLNWSNLYHTRGAFVAVWRMDFLFLGGRRSWKWRDHLRSDYCSSGGDVD